MNKVPAYILALMIVLSGCKTLGISVSANKENPEKILDKIENHYLDYSILKIKYSGKYESGSQNFDFAGTMLIYKDSLIKTNVSYLFGIPVAFIKISKDSVKIKSSFFENIEGDINRLGYTFGIPLNYSQLEAIVSNKLFTFPAGNSIDNYKIIKNNNKYIFEYRKKDTASAYTQIWHYIETDSLLNIKENKIWDFRNGKNLEAYIEYQSFKQINDKRFPGKLMLTIIDNDTTKLILTYKTVKVVK